MDEGQQYLLGPLIHIAHRGRLRLWGTRGVFTPGEFYAQHLGTMVYVAICHFEIGAEEEIPGDTISVPFAVTDLFPVRLHELM